MKKDIGRLPLQILRAARATILFDPIAAAITVFRRRARCADSFDDGRGHGDRWSVVRRLLTGEAAVTPFPVTLAMVAGALAVPLPAYAATTMTPPGESSRCRSCLRRDGRRLLMTAIGAAISTVGNRARGSAIGRAVSWASM
jgi:hypothetical protein